VQIFLNIETEKAPAIVSAINELSLRHHSPYKEITKKKNKTQLSIIIMQDTNNTGSDHQESSSADMYLAVRAKHAGTQYRKDFLSH